MEELQALGSWEFFLELWGENFPDLSQIIIHKHSLPLKDLRYVHPNSPDEGPYRVNHGHL